MQKVLAKLLKENVSIRNLPIIFETLADFGKITTDTDLLAEYVRQAFARQITNQYTEPSETLKVITLSGKVEKMIADNIQQTEQGNYLSMDPPYSQRILNRLLQISNNFHLMQQAPIFLCSPAVRMYVSQMTERYFPHVPVLSYNELEANVEVQSVGVVNIE